MAFMHETGVFTEKITIPGKGLRGKINVSVFKKCIDTYLKTEVDPGEIQESPSNNTGGAHL
jgi:hypothetical protein